MVTTDAELISTTNAPTWAEEFALRFYNHPDVVTDIDTMTAWFANAIEAGSAAGLATSDGEWEFGGYVHDAGGGHVTIEVDRDTNSYPIRADRVRVIVTPMTRSEESKRNGRAEGQQIPDGVRGDSDVEAQAPGAGEGTTSGTAAQPETVTTSFSAAAFRSFGIAYNQYDEDGRRLTHQHECTRCGWHDLPNESKPRSEHLAALHMEDCPRRETSTAGPMRPGWGT